MKKKITKKTKTKRFPDFRLIPDSLGIILDSMWIKNDNSELIIVSAFGGQWHFKPLAENETSL